MARIATIEDFGVPGQSSGYLYDDGYREYPFHDERAAWIASRWPGIGKTIVVGCALGYLVKHLRLLGIEAYGFDLSQWAIDRVDPAAAPFCMFADTARQQDRRAVKQMAGIASNGRFALAVTEDVLPVLTDNEAGVLVSVCQSDALNVGHIITCTHPEIPGDLASRYAPLNWKSQAEWRALINSAGGTAHVCYDTELKVTF